ncbi:MAG: GreA/GreB family elongation factor [Simkania negevensis]|nr:GreA/GreB family elongation factor [Simkania negevensis]
MNYLPQFQKHIHNNDYSSFLILWEEYCLGDEADDELALILESVKDSQIAEPFGRQVEQILSLWEKIKETELGKKILKYILDLQTTNSQTLKDLAIEYLKQEYPNDPLFNEKIRFVGLRDGKNFQKGISNFILLSHMKKGNFVFHSGGWGVGEIMDVSFLREELSIEFEYIPGVKDLSFQNSFKTLIPLSPMHFLSLRFGNVEKLEALAKEDPLELVRLMLHDLGPLTANEIKEELVEFVIPVKEWTRWWQQVRGKIRKDSLIETPEDLSNPFILRETKISHEDQLHKLLKQKIQPNELIQIVYSFLRDFPGTLKNDTFKNQLIEKLKEALAIEELTDAAELQIHFFLQDLSEEKEYPSVAELVKRFPSPEDLINEIEIVAFKKRFLVEVQRLRKDWKETFESLFLKIDQHTLRDYLLAELLKHADEVGIKKKLEELLSFPSRYPAALPWYFQKIMKESSLPFANREGKNRFFESFLILLSMLEQTPGHRDLIKKMHAFLAANRYAIVRKVFEHASKEYVQEFLLLSTKCQSLTDHDIKIFHSLAQVVHPSLKKFGEKFQKEEEIPIWATQEGYEKIKERIKQISTVETVENAKEIEAARALGDLRENAEFKAALEKRNRLQNELKQLSEQFNKAQVLVKEDVSTDKVSVGVVVEFQGKAGEKISYTLLGPWEADPDRHILSFQSKLAQSLMGKRVGEKVTIQGEPFVISNLRNYFDT